MKNINISIIVPIYNVERYLEQCLQSLANQTLKGIEIICVNDGSTDKSLDIAKKYVEKHNNFKLIDKQNGGYGAAVNVGINASKGTYIGIVEPDDFVSNKMYEILYSEVKKDSEIDIVKAGYWNYIDENIEKPIKTKQLTWKLISGTKFNIYQHTEVLKTHPSIWSCIYKKEFLEKYDIKMIEAKGAGWVDNPFLYETLCQAKKICWIATPVYFYRQARIGSSSDLKDCSIPIDRMNDIFNFLLKKNIKNKKILKEAYNRTFLYITKIEKNENFCKKNHEEIVKILKRMDKNIIKNLELKNIDIYNKYSENKIKSKIKNKIKTKIKNKIKKIIKNIYSK